MRSFSVLILVLLFQMGFAQTSGPDWKAIEAYIEKARQQWEAPGLAVAVVHQGKVVFQKGFGNRRLGSPEKVDENTLFAMCSTTKAVTAAAMAILVDRGKARWNDPVVEHMPEFQLSDPYATRSVRVRDLLTHNAGLGNADFLWYNSDLSQAEILGRLRYAPMAYPIRGGYTYQNVMYMAAGMLIEKLSGKPWETFIQEEFFTPLGMSRTYPLQKQIPASEKNRSNAHYKVKGEIKPIPDIQIDPAAPAGSIWASVSDMSRWMQFMLDSARINGRRLISAESYRELFRPQTIVSDEGFYPTQQLTRPTWKTYGLGWFQHDYLGRPVHFHTGSIDGTVAICGLLPSEKVGVYVFGNLDHAEVRHAIMYKVFDQYLGQRNGRDWSSDLLTLYKGLAAKGEEAEKKFVAARKAGTSPTHPLEAFTGRYTDPFRGEMTVVLENGQLVLRFGSQAFFTLEHWQYNTFLGKSSQFWQEPLPVSFETDIQGEIRWISVLGGKLKKDAQAGH